jgi:arginase
MMEKSITVISVPYDSAHFNVRMGAGPLHIINKGLVPKFKSLNKEVRYQEILLQETFPTEIASTFRLLSLLKREIVKATERQSFPIVLSGNCCATVSVIAGLRSSDMGVVWFDAHGDCETPETTASGFLDGMGMSLLTNRCWKHLLLTHELDVSLPGERIALIGARDLSEHEKRFISTNGIHHVTVEQVKQPGHTAIRAACWELAKAGVERLHLHIDVDVFDPSTAIANSYAVNKGLNKGDVIEVINCLTSEFGVASLTIASYDPSFDRDDRMWCIIQELVELIANQI